MVFARPIAPASAFWLRHRFTRWTGDQAHRKLDGRYKHPTAEAPADIRGVAWSPLPNGIIQLLAAQVRCNSVHFCARPWNVVPRCTALHRVAPKFSRIVFLLCSWSANINKVIFVSSSSSSSSSSFQLCFSAILPVAIIPISLSLLDERGTFPPVILQRLLTCATDLRSTNMTYNGSSCWMSQL